MQNGGQERRYYKKSTSFAVGTKRRERDAVEERKRVLEGHHSQVASGGRTSLRRVRECHTRINGATVERAPVITRFRCHSRL